MDNKLNVPKHKADKFLSEVRKLKEQERKLMQDKKNELKNKVGVYYSKGVN